MRGVLISWSSNFWLISNARNKKTFSMSTKREKKKEKALAHCPIWSLLKLHHFRSAVDCFGASWSHVYLPFPPNFLTSAAFWNSTMACDPTSTVFYYFVLQVQSQSFAVVLWSTKLGRVIQLFMACDYEGFNNGSSAILLVSVLSDFPWRITEYRINRASIVVTHHAYFKLIL